MYYVIEAIHWDPAGRVSHVRWHRVSVDAGADVRHEPAEVVAVIDAARVCRSAEVRVYVDGETGQFFKMKACPEGIDAEDHEGAPLAQRLGHLPSFELEAHA